MAAERFEAARDAGASMKRFTVGPNDRGWYVSRRFAPWASSVHELKAEAVKRGAELAREKKPSRLIIRRSDGSVQEEREYT